MLLHQKSDLLNLMIPSTNKGEMVSALKVFGLSLKYVAEHALEQCNKKMIAKYSKEDVYWLLTVPAIWTEGAKAFMMKAAEMAELTSNPHHIDVAREPEAASLACRLWYALDNTPLAPGDRWIVMDCGGGTIDSVIHELEEDGKSVKEVCTAADANAFGSTRIDKEFVRLLMSVVGKDAMEEFLRTCQHGALDLFDAIAVTKHGMTKPAT